MDLFDELRTLTRTLGEANVSVVSRKGLVTLKLAAGRPQDLVDVQRLQEVPDDEG